MKWEVGFRIKDSIRNWSDQIIDTNYNGVCCAYMDKRFGM